MPHFEDISRHNGQQCADIVNSYESSIDMFAHETHHLCDLPIHFDHSSSIESHSNHVMANVYKEGAESGHQSPHHQSLLIDEDEYELSKHTSLAGEIELVFHHVSYSISTNSCKDRPILSDISGYAAPGQVLAVMGPSGSGKTTLLNLLSGRLKPCAGEISLNGQKINKQLRRRICYVLQQDIFFPSLTLKQTLMYTARLRLSDSVKNREKRQLVERIIEELQLKDCQDTIIGDVSKRGLSGGEKKRANIACELLTNPSVMLIDEPTSGLDSCTAHNLVQILKNFAVKSKKTIVMTIHQPSSQMFYMLDRLLLLTNGQLAYIGNVVDVVPFFNSIGHSISMHYNPAEFILEKVKDVNYQDKIVEAAKSLRKLPRYSEEKCLCLQTKQAIQQQACGDSWKKESLKSIELHVAEENQGYNSSKTIISDNDSGRSSWSETDRSSTFSSHSYFRDDNFSGNQHTTISGPKWPTSVMTQIQVLTERNFIEARHRMLSKLNWIQTIVLAIVAGLIWFQIPRKEETINDIRGWMFFTTTYWMLFGLFQALVSFPSEREVINKERSSGAYRLSSYYIAKMIGELPLTVALPSVFFLVSYPMMGCSSVLTFVSMWFFLVIATICAQSVGLFIGAACYDLEVSVTLSALYSLSTMLFAGYYTSMPPWLSWMRYLSMVYYAFLNMQMVEFAGSPIQCANESSKYKYCQLNSNASQTREVQYEQLELHLDLMNDGSPPFPIWFNTIILLMFLVVFRSMGYLVLRFTRKPTT